MSNSFNEEPQNLQNGNNAIQIFVKFLSNKEETFYVYPYTTINELKQKIEAKLKINASQQRLLYNGKVLDDKNEGLIGDYGIQNSSIIYVIVNTTYQNNNQSSQNNNQSSQNNNQSSQNDQLNVIQVFARTINGKTIKVDTNLDAKVEELLNLIKEKDGSPQNAIRRLIYEGKQLVEGKTLREYSIHDNSTLNLVIHMKGGK